MSAIQYFAQVEMLYSVTNRLRVCSHAKKGSELTVECKFMESVIKLHNGNQPENREHAVHCETEPISERLQHNQFLG